MNNERKYDVAAYIWPAYSGNEERTRIFWPEGIGEWETVKKAQSKFIGHTWPRKPVLGYQNEADPTVMEEQIELAAENGVNVFAYDWYWYDGRPFLENCLKEGYLGAKNNHKVKFFLMWANHSVGFTWDIRNSDTFRGYFRGEKKNRYLYNGAIDIHSFEKMTDYIIDNYFALPNYYRIDGRPVFMLFSLTEFIKGMEGIDGAGDALLAFKNKCIARGVGEPYFIMNIHRAFRNIADEDGRILPTSELIERLHFDGTTNYQFIDTVEDANRSYNEVVADNYLEWERIDSENPVPYFPQVSVGWDNNPRFNKIMYPIVHDTTPERFRRVLQRAKEFLDARPEQAPLITINSWNEWTESSYLLPDDIFGYGYLDAVRRVFGGEPREKNAKMVFSSMKEIVKKIEESDDYTIISAGDSLTEGQNSTRAENTYTAVFARELGKKFADRKLVRYDGKRFRRPDCEIMPIMSYGEPIVMNKGEEGGKKLTVVRSGIGGNSVRRLLNRRADFIGKEIDGKCADLFIFSVGINDSIISVPSKYASPEQYKKDLYELIALVKERHPDADVILMTPTWFDEGKSNESWVDAYAEAMKELASAYGIPVIDQHKLWMDHLEIGSYNFGQRDWLGSKDECKDFCHPNDVGHAAMAEEMIRAIFND